MARYHSGRRFEYQVRDFLKSRNYVTVRSAGSKGCVDLIAWTLDETLVIQCKKERKKGNYKKDIKRLFELPVRVGWCRQLWVKNSKVVSVFEVVAADRVRFLKDFSLKEMANGD